MIIPVTSTADLGLLLRATRHTHGLRLDDVAGSAGVGYVFAGDVEHGKETVQLGRVLRLLDELGVRLYADIPAAVLPELEKLKSTGLKPRKPRKSAKPGTSDHD